MLTQLALRALRSPRTPLSPPSQPCARLQPSRARTLQTSAPSPSQGPSRQQLQWNSPRSSSRTFSRPAYSSSPVSSTSPRPRPWTFSRPACSSSPVPSTFRAPSSRRPFSSTGRSHRQNRYNRFNGGGRQSPFHALIHRAKPHHFVVVGLGISGFYFYNTDVVEMTGRRRFNCVPHTQELKMGAQSYREILNSERGKILPDYHPLTRTVDRVLQRLIPQAPIEGANWKVHVIKDDGMANAFVLPGGKVFVYTGIMPICQDEDGLAAVLGHEIAHVVAHHPGERMSTSFLTLGAVFLLATLFDISGSLPSMVLNLMWSLPNSRTQEAEADNIGLMIMAKACFNPEAAVKLWKRMQKQEKVAPPQFMSTHPSSYNREEAIRGWLEKAEGIYAENGCSSLGSYMPAFHNAYRSQAQSGW